MPLCCVADCKNTSENGFLFRCLPKDNQLRAIWIRNINRPNWVPNRTHRVCEVHFAPHMWEKVRVDGKRKLKFNAVPTIFGDRVIMDPPPLNILVPPDTNETEYVDAEILGNDLTHYNQTLIRAIPPVNVQKLKFSELKTKLTNKTKTIIINKEGIISNLHTIPSSSGSTIISEPHDKTSKVHSLPILSSNTSILKNQLQSASNRAPIIIPAKASVLKPKIKNIILKPKSTGFPNEVVDTGSILITESGIPSSYSPNSESQIETITLSDNEINISRETAPASTCIVLNKAEAKKIDEERFQKMDKLLLKQLRLNNAMRKKLNFMRNKMQQMVSERKNDYRKYLIKVFTEDQIRALEMKYHNPKSIIAWSHATMMKALKLKEYCGSKGYNELLKQNMPIPSIRTISRWCSLRNIPIP